MNNTAIKLVYLSPISIDFDKNNPRGETVAQITNDHEFEKLKASIEEFGILEPLIVKGNENDTNKYILIDGERRLRAARATKAITVPAIVATSQANGRILAYHIHKLRKEWSKITEVKSIKSIIKGIRESNPDIAPGEIKKEVLQITGMRSHEAEDLIKLSHYDEKIITAAINGELSMSYLVQIESNFVRPIKKKFPQILNKFDEDKIRQILAEKARKEKLGNTRYLMDTFKEVFAHHSDRTESILLEFLHKKDMDITFAFDWFKGVKAPPLLLTSTTQTQDNTASQSEVQNSQNPPQNESSKKTEAESPTPIKSQSSNKSKIAKPKSNAIALNEVRAAYDKIAGTLSDIEKRYMIEAITCLEYKCFKAAILMIWAALIAKIHNFIEKDLNEFNNASNAMQKNQRSVYKHIAKNFVLNVKDISALKQDPKDIQLLCYLYYRNIITESQFKKMKGNYDKRCDCAHPTDITLTDNEVVAIFENALDYIFANKSL